MRAGLVGIFTVDRTSSPGRVTGRIPEWAVFTVALTLLRCASVLAAPSCVPLAPVTIAFEGLTGNGSPFSTYSLSGFTVLPTSGSWTIGTDYGDPAPFIYFTRSAEQGAITAAVSITAGGSPFSFRSVDLYSSVTTIPYVFTGLLDSAMVFSVSDTLPNTFGGFATVMNPRSADVIDTLLITLTNPATPCCSNPMGLDNVAVAQSLPGARPPPPADFDGDGKTDITVYRPSHGAWYILESNTLTVSTVMWGSSADVPVPGDYDADGRTDIGVYRDTTGEWFIHRSSDAGLTHVDWGAAASSGLGDVPVPADFDGDCATDIGVYRNTTGEWFIRRSSDGGVTTLGWGWPGGPDVPVRGDFDADGRTDLGVYRGTTGEWFIRRSSDEGLTHVYWGARASSGLGDIPVAGDYDGDGASDLAVYRGTTGEWFIRRSIDGSVTYLGWGWPGGGDVPMAGDYEADGLTDIVVYRGTTGEWFIHRSSDAGLTHLAWGWPAGGDRPVPSHR